MATQDPLRQRAIVVPSKAERVKNFHHETFNPEGDWKIPGTGPMSDANGALPFIVFERDKEKFENKSFEIIFNPQIAFYYYPTGNQNNKIYLRFNYFANSKQDANNFYQLQFGIKTGLKLPSK